jgi:hypothetical protein
MLDRSPLFTTFPANKLARSCFRHGFFFFDVAALELMNLNIFGVVPPIVIVFLIEKSSRCPKSNLWDPLQAPSKFF